MDEVHPFRSTLTRIGKGKNQVPVIQQGSLKLHTSLHKLSLTVYLYPATFTDAEKLDKDANLSQLVEIPVPAETLPVFE